MLYDKQAINLILTQAGCILAVVWASKHALKRWIAVSSLTPPASDTVDKNQEDETSPRLTGWKRVFHQTTGQKLKPIFAICCFYSFVFLILPRIRSQMVVDGSWICIMMVPTIITIDTSLRTILPLGLKARYVPAPPTSKSSHQVRWDMSTAPRYWTFVPIMLGFGSFFAYYMGVSAITGIISSCFVLTMIATPAFAKLNMRHLVIILNAYIFSILILSLVVFGLISFFTNSDESSTPNEGSDNGILSPSDWMMEYMLIGAQAIPSVLPGIMLAAAMRYDHSKTVSLQVKAEPGDSVPIPKHIDRFDKPTFNAGLLGLVLSLSAFVIANTQFGFPSAILTSAVIVSVPLTTTAMVLSLWSRGQCKDWWMYSERWMPLREESKQGADDIEARLAEDIVDEAETEKLLREE